MELISTIFYFLIVIGILVFVHEFGHFAAARLSGIRAEVFAFGMGYRLFGYNKVNGFTLGKLRENIDLGSNTDFRICAFPIGGYVKIAGMIDESMDKNFIKTEPKPWEYRAKPVWKRMIVITAGVIMNIILAFLIFYFITLSKGKNYTYTTTVGYVSPSSVAYEFGIRDNDKILSINGNRIEYWDEIQTQLYIDNLGEDVNIELKRDNQRLFILFPKEKLGILTDRNFGIYPDKLIPVINSVNTGSPADIAGIKSGDIITRFAGLEIDNAQKLVDLIKKSANTETNISWLRDGNEMTAKITSSKDSTLGISYISKYEGPVKNIRFNVLTAIPQTFNEMYYYGVEVFFKSIVKIVKGDIPFRKAIGGPVKIAQASAQSAEGGFLTFMGFVALLSMSLAVINILPFPALDGGHFMILMWEAIFRKPVSYKVQIALQNIGFIILLAFMLFVIYNDIISIK